MFAQLRDVLTAKNSSIVTKKNDDSRLALPQRTQTNFSPKGVRENDVCELLAQSFHHDGPSLEMRDSSVKAVKHKFLDYNPRNRESRRWHQPGTI